VQYFGGEGGSCAVVWTQDLEVSRQALYHLSHALSPFCFYYFSDSILLWADVSLRSPSSYICPRIAGITSMSHCAQPGNISNVLSGDAKVLATLWSAKAKRTRTGFGFDLGSKPLSVQPLTVLGKFTLLTRPNNVGSLLLLGLFCSHAEVVRTWALEPGCLIFEYWIMSPLVS
jgi:hypothetical protein